MIPLKNLLHTGVTLGQSAQDRRTIIITNYLSVILPGIVFCLLIYRVTVIGSSRVTDLLVVGFLLFTPLLLNRLRLYSLSQVVISLIPFCFLWFISWQGLNRRGSVDVFMYDGLRLYMIASGIIPYLIFNWSRPAVSLLCTIPTIASLVFIDTIFSNMAGKEVAGTDFGLVPIRTWIAYTIISSGGLVLQYIIYRNDLFNEALVSELKAKNEELEASRQALNSINLDLESAVLQKTHSLKLKNQALVKFAYANAHHIRGPLARILGLIQISKIDTSTDIHDLFEKVKSESEEMDTIVRGISNELDNLSHEDRGQPKDEA